MFLGSVSGVTSVGLFQMLKISLVPQTDDDNDSEEREVVRSRGTFSLSSPDHVGRLDVGSILLLSREQKNFVEGPSANNENARFRENLREPPRFDDELTSNTVENLSSTLAWVDSSYSNFKTRNNKICELLVSHHNQFCIF